MELTRIFLVLFHLSMYYTFCRAETYNVISKTAVGCFNLQKRIECQEFETENNQTCKSSTYKYQPSHSPRFMDIPLSCPEDYRIIVRNATYSIPKLESSYCLTTTCYILEHSENITICHCCDPPFSRCSKPVDVALFKTQKDMCEKKQNNSCMLQGFPLRNFRHYRDIKECPDYSCDDPKMTQKCNSRWVHVHYDCRSLYPVADEATTEQVTVAVLPSEPRTMSDMLLIGTVAGVSVMLLLLVVTIIACILVIRKKKSGRQKHHKSESLDHKPAQNVYTDNNDNEQMEMLTHGRQSTEASNQYTDDPKYEESNHYASVPVHTHNNQRPTPLNALPLITNSPDNTEDSDTYHEIQGLNTPTDRRKNFNNISNKYHEIQNLDRMPINQLNIPLRQPSNKYHQINSDLINPDHLNGPHRQPSHNYHEIRNVDEIQNSDNTPINQLHLPYRKPSNNYHEIRNIDPTLPQRSMDKLDNNRPESDDIITPPERLNTFNTSANVTPFIPNNDHLVMPMNSDIDQFITPLNSNSVNHYTSTDLNTQNPSSPEKEKVNLADLYSVSSKPVKKNPAEMVNNNYYDSSEIAEASKNHEKKINSKLNDMVDNNYYDSGDIVNKHKNDKISAFPENSAHTENTQNTTKPKYADTQEAVLAKDEGKGFVEDNDVSGGEAEYAYTYGHFRAEGRARQPHGRDKQDQI